MGYRHHGEHRAGESRRPVERWVPAGVVRAEDAPVIDLRDPRDEQGRPISGSQAIQRRVRADLGGIPVIDTGQPYVFPRQRLTAEEREAMLDTVMPGIQAVHDRLGPSGPAS